MKYTRFITKCILGLGGLFAIFNSCSMQSVDNNFYKILNKVNLEKDLKEISGLTYYKDGKFLAVQDELGIIYVLDENSGRIQEEWKFGKNGDYEGITLANNMVYVLRSDGDLYRYNTKADETDKISNPHVKDYEFEGLCYDQAKQQLILSCKDTHGSKKDKHMLFYGYDLKTDSWIKDPIYKLNKKEIEALAGFDVSPLKASGIIQSPINQDFYIVASLGSVLIQLSSDFVPKRVIPLHANFNQPEGICINSNGNLVISNEANKKQKATIYTLELK